MLKLKADLNATLHCIARRMWNIQNAGKMLYMSWDRNCVVQLLLQLENKQQIMQNNVEILHKHMYSLYIVSYIRHALPVS